MAGEKENQRNSVEENVRRAMTKAIFDEMLQMLEERNEKEISKEELIARLKKIVAEPPKEKIERCMADGLQGRKIKERFWHEGDISCEGGAVVLRSVQEDDRGGFLRLKRENAFLRTLPEEGTYQRWEWAEHNGDTSLMLSIVRNGQYIGYCGVKDTAEEPWEIAVELLPEWRRQGIGTAAVRAMLDAVGSRLGETAFRVRIDPANTASQRLFEKLGARPNGISEFLLHDEEAIMRCEEINLPRIDGRLIALAGKFGVEPRKLLSHVLEYTLRWETGENPACSRS